MKQFGKILKFEFTNYLKNKIFVGVTAVLVILIALVMFIPRIGEAISFDTSDSDMTRPVMLIKANDETQTALVKNAFSEAFSDYEVKSTSQDVEDIKKAITNEEAECAFVMSSPTKYVYYVNNLSMYDVNTATADALLQNVYRTIMMLESGMTVEQTNEVMTMEIEGSTETLGKDQMENFLYTYVMIFALYMVILLYGQMVATNVATEKSSRAMELLITSAKPRNMMFGKVIASCLAGLLQLVAIFGSAVLFYNINKGYWGDNPLIDSVFNIPNELLVYMLVFFMLGFLIYAFLYGAIGSTASKLEDINTSVMPLTFMFIIAFLVVSFSMSSGDMENMALKICSFIPFTSPMAMFTRIAMSTVAWYEIASSIAILAVSVVGVGIISAKIYRVGVVMYGTTPKISNIIKAIRKS